jgi:hypothetical protein
MTTPFSNIAVALGQPSVQMKIVSKAKMPASTWQGNVLGVIGNNQSTIRLYFGDKGTKVYQPFGNIIFAGTVDPSTYPDADIVDGDFWADTTVAATPTMKILVAGAWNTIA